MNESTNFQVPALTSLNAPHPPHMTTLSVGMDLDS